MSAEEVLRKIKTKRSVNKDDLQKILKLSESEQKKIIGQISNTRQNQLMKYLQDLPQLDDHFNFFLSRRESNISQNNTSFTKQTLGQEVSEKLQEKEQIQSPPLKAKNIQLNWTNDVKQKYDDYQIKFSCDIPPLNDKSQTEKSQQQQCIQLFSEEKDHIIQLIKRIMYAEGDLINLTDECAEYLKDSLQILVQIFKSECNLEDQRNDSKHRQLSSVKKRIEKQHHKQQHQHQQPEDHKYNIINMMLLKYVFSESIQRFYTHKSLSKYYRDVEDNEEANLESLAEQAQQEDHFLEFDIFGDAFKDEKSMMNNGEESENAGGEELKMERLNSSHKRMSDVLKELKDEENEGDDGNGQDGDEAIIGEELWILEHSNFTGDNNNGCLSLAADKIGLGTHDEKKEKSDFQNMRAQNLDGNEYLAFHQCRLTNFLS